MIRLFALIPGCLILGTSFAGAVPARPRYEPPEAPKPAAALTIHGVWRGTLLTKGTSVEIGFTADGKVQYSRPNKDGTGKLGSSGSWRLEGNKVIFDINQYSEHRGVLIGNVIEGESSNKTGLRGTFRLERVGPGR